MCQPGDDETLLPLLAPATVLTVTTQPVERTLEQKQNGCWVKYVLPGTDNLPDGTGEAATGSVIDAVDRVPLAPDYTPPPPTRTSQALFRLHWTDGRSVTVGVILPRADLRPSIPRERRSPSRRSLTGQSQPDGELPGVVGSGAAIDRVPVSSAKRAPDRRWKAATGVVIRTRRQRKTEVRTAPRLAAPLRVLLALGTLLALAGISSRQAGWAFPSRRHASPAGARLAPLVAGLVSGTWKELGPRPLRTDPSEGGVVAGRTMALLLQKRSGRLIVGAASGGIWKRSLSARGTFAPKSDFAESLSIGALAEDPSHPDTLFAGTGEPSIQDGSFDGAGLLRSTDGGESWQRIDDGTFSGRRISGLWVDPTGADHLRLTSYFDGCYDSVDGGVTWRRLLSGYALRLIVSPADSNRILVSNSYPYGDPASDLFLSTDGGTTFAPVRGPWQGPGTTVGRISAAFAPSNPSVVWVSVAPPINGTDNGQAGIYRSTDGGATYSAMLLTEDHNVADWHGNPIVVSPSDANLIYLGGFSPCRYRAGGVVTFLGRGIHEDQKAFAFDPNDVKTLYAINDGGVFVTHDGGSHWSNLNAGLGTIQFYAGAVGTHNGLLSLFGSTQDNGSCRPTTGLSWAETIGGDGFDCAVDPQAENVVYATSYNSTYFFSSDSGITFRPLADLPMLPEERGPFLTPIALDPADTARIYGLAQRVYRGISDRRGGVTWTPLSAGLLFEFNSRYRIAVAPSDGNTIYASGGTQLARTTTGGDPWEYVQPPGGATISGVAVHPAEPAYVVVTQWAPAGAQVMRSLDGGSTWSSIAANLPPVTVNNVTLNLTAGGLDTFLATSEGVYYADLNAGAVAWTLLGTGLPHAQVLEVLIVDRGDRVVAVTHGRGMWLLGDGPTSLAAKATSKSSAALSWRDLDGSETGFLVERKSAGDYQQAAALRPNVTRFKDNRLAAGATYTYRIRSTLPTGPSAYSNEATVTLPGGKR